MSQHGSARPWDTAAHGPVAGPVHASYSATPGSAQATPLLDLITQQSLDEDYRHVAGRRERGGAARARSLRTVLVVAAFGLLVAVAAVQTSRNASIDNADKNQLIDRITARRSAVADLQKQIAALRTATTHEEAQYGALGRALNDATATETRLRRTTGWGEVSGDGVRVRIDDAPGGSTDGQVRDSDLAGLVNGLWQAGATAVSVNGQRVTALSALRNTASVVRINDTSLSPPYTVLALGDRNTLQARFAQSTSGIRLRALTRTYAMPFSMHNETDLTLPAAPSSMLVLHHARSTAGPKTVKEMP